MSRTTFDPKTDPQLQRYVEHGTAAMCAADGCPNRWTVHRDGWQPLCSAHAWAHPKAWPRITQEQVEWIEQHRRYGEVMAAQRSSITPVPRRAPQAPQSSSRAWRALHGVDDIEPDREP